MKIRFSFHCGDGGQGLGARKRSARDQEGHDDDDDVVVGLLLAALQAWH